VLIDVGRRAFFFFSRFGFIVSLLALSRRLPFASNFPDAPRSPGIFNGAWGTELTVSVSTVMLRVGGSLILLLPLARFVKDLLARLDEDWLPIALLGIVTTSGLTFAPALSLSLSPLPVADFD